MEEKLFIINSYIFNFELREYITYSNIYINKRKLP